MQCRSNEVSLYRGYDMKPQPPIFRFTMETKHCYQCKQDKAVSLFNNRASSKDGKDNRCKDCNKMSCKKHYQDNSDVCKIRALKYKYTEKHKIWYKEYFQKVKSSSEMVARKRVYCALKSGVLVKKDFCERCLVKCSTQAHHYDYKKPLEVLFVCIPCHNIIHQHEQHLIKH